MTLTLLFVGAIHSAVHTYSCTSTWHYCVNAALSPITRPFKMPSSVRGAESFTGGCHLIATEATDRPSSQKPEFIASTLFFRHSFTNRNRFVYLFLLTAVGKEDL